MKNIQKVPLRTKVIIYDIWHYTGFKKYVRGYEIQPQNVTRMQNTLKCQNIPNILILKRQLSKYIRSHCHESSGSQTVFCGTLVCRCNFAGMLPNLLNGK